MPARADHPRTLELRAGRSPWARLLFVEDRGRYFVLPSAELSAWYFEAASQGGAWVRTEPGHERSCASRIVYRADELARVRSLFRAKYGAEATEAHFAKSRRALSLDPTRVAVTPTWESRVRDEFDSVAAGYDESIDHQPIERYLKDRAADLLGRSLAGLDPLLEIGPGTGFHTLRLLADGHRVTAVDISSEMLSQLRQRAEAADLAGRLEVRLGRLSDLGRILEDVPDGAFRGAYSAFGAFNIEPTLRPAVRALARLIAPGGRLVIAALNRPGLAPMAWELLMGRAAAAFRRVAEVVPVNGIRYPLELHVPSADGWDALLEPGFRRRRREPVSVVAPPFGSDRAVAFLGERGGRRVRDWDRRLARVPGSWAAAEWVLFDYERRTKPEPPSAA